MKRLLRSILFISLSLHLSAFGKTAIGSFDAEGDILSKKGIGKVAKSSPNATPESQSGIAISCDWTGALSTSWNNAGNWLNGIIPSGNDNAFIGVNWSFGNFPNIPASLGIVNVGSVTFGCLGGKSAGLIVNTGSTLDVAGAVTYQSDLNSALGYTCTVSGAGTLNANTLIVKATSGLLLSYTLSFASSVTNLNIAANISLTSTKSLLTVNNSKFTVTGGTALIKGTIQTTNANFSTSSFIVNPISTATLQLNNITALSGLSLSGTNLINFNNAGATIEYSGASQTLYTDAGIPGLPGGVNYDNIKFSGTGVKSASSGNLNIAGDYTTTLANDLSNYVNLLSPVVNFNGTIQSLAGGPGKGTTLYNAKFTGAGTKTMISGTFNFPPSGTLTMGGTNVSTILATGGFLTLHSDTTGSASVAAILPAGPSVTGNVTVERFVTGGSTKNAITGRYTFRTYRLMSSPVNEGVDASGYRPVSLNYLAASTIITDATSTFGTTPGNPSLYLYNENYTPSNLSFTSGNFIGVTNVSSTVPSGQITTTDASNTSAKLYTGDGFMIYFRGDKINNLSGIPSKTKSPFVAPENVVFSATGNLNQGTYSVNSWTGYAGLLFTTSNAGNVPVRGFNLVGNPYASSIDWSLFSNTNSAAPIYGANVNPSIYILNPRTNNYDVYSASTGIATGSAGNVIPSGQGFFVRANNSAPTLTFKETAKTPVQLTGSNLLMGQPANQTAYRSYMRLKLVSDSTNFNDIVIGFNSSSTTKYNPELDAEYIPGLNAVQALAAITGDNVKTSIKWLPLPKANEQQVIKLTVSGLINGIHSLTRTDLKELPDIFEVWLMDKFKGDSVDIRHNTNYSFNMDRADSNTYGSGRFQLVIRQNPALTVHLLNFTAVKATNGSQLVWKTENEQNYTNFTVQRSTDNGITFNTLGGFSSSAEGLYSFLDKNPLITVDQYRVMIQNLDGAISYSKVIPIMYTALSNNIVAGNISIYPNPATSTLNLSISPNTVAVSGNASSTSYDITVVNSTGTIIKTAVSSQHNWQYAVGNLIPGTYLIQVVNSGDKSLVGKGRFVKI